MVINVDGIPQPCLSAIISNIRNNLQYGVLKIESSDYNLHKIDVPRHK